MVQIDVPLAFGIGGLFASASHRQLQRQPDDSHRVWLEANLYYVFFYSWPPVYLLETYFGWQTSHMWWHADTLSDVPWLAPALIVATGAALNAGFLTSRRLVRAGRVGTSRIISIATIVFAVAWILATGDRTSRLGTYSEWLAGRAPRAVDDPHFVRTLGVFLGIAFGTLVVMLVRLRLAGRRADLAPDDEQAAQRHQGAR